MTGTLYIVGTPIGNLADLTPRAAQIFSTVDFIAAEDTRVTLKLLNHLDIKKSMISYNQHNCKSRGQVIIDRLLQGESCALCSDAGMPAISDPGEMLVTEAHQLGIPVVPVPAACAAIAALAVSGQSTGRFVFEGFITQNKRQRSERLELLKTEPRTLLLYEAPHKLNATLQDLCRYFGEQRPVTLCRELTKLHEEILVTTLGQAAAHYQERAPKGEFVLVIAGAPPIEEGPEISLEQAAQQALDLAADLHLSASDAAKRTAAQTGYSKSAIYKLMQQIH